MATRRPTPPRGSRAAQARLFAAADRAAVAVDAAVHAWWRGLLTVLRDPGGHAYGRALAALRALPAVIAGAMRDRLAGLALLGHRQAAGVLGGQLRRPVREEADPLADLFPAPSVDWVALVLAPFVRPADWRQLGTDAHKRMPEDLAAQIAASMAAGKTHREVARDIQPLLDGSRVRAVRAARTFGLHAAHAGQRAAWDQAGDLIAGFTVHATFHNTRPEHAARDGTTYWKNPRPGQKGMDECPRPPLEADGSIAWNCACWLTPVLSP